MSLSKLRENDLCFSLSPCDDVSGITCAPLLSEDNRPGGKQRGEQRTSKQIGIYLCETGGGRSSSSSLESR